MPLIEKFEFKTLKHLLGPTGLLIEKDDMELRADIVETMLKKNFNRYTLSQVERSITELLILLKKFRKFDFKKHSNFTALEFELMKSKLEKNLKDLNFRRDEILLKRAAQ